MLQTSGGDGRSLIAPLLMYSVRRVRPSGHFLDSTAGAFGPGPCDAMWALNLTWAEVGLRGFLLFSIFPPQLYRETVGLHQCRIGGAKVVCSISIQLRLTEIGLKSFQSPVAVLKVNF